MQQQLQEALAAQQSGNLEQAEHLFKQLLNASNGHPVVQAHYASFLCQTRRARQAIPHLKAAVEGLPKEVSLVQQAVHIASQLGEHDLVELWLEQLIGLVGEQAPLLEQLAGTQVACQKEERALATLKKLFRLTPQNPNAQNLKGLALCRLGDDEKGYKCFQKAVELNPGNLAALRNLIIYGKRKKEPLLDEILPQLQRRLNQPGLDGAARMNIGYMLAMYYEKRDPAASFSALEMANRLNRQQYQYSHEETLKQFKLLVDAFDDEFIAAAKPYVMEESGPVFVLGMPRSGTTLIEQILSSHSEVEAEGEIEDLRKCFEKEGQHLFKPVAVDERVSAGKRALQSYLDLVRKRQTATYFTDKMPYNFMLIGLIAALMPNAKIVHCTREPLETCYSIYKQNFSGSHAYSNDQKELGQYFNAYGSLMRMWAERFPDQIYEANYEALIKDSESEISKLLEFCGLELQPACIAFHRNKRAVRTASVAQVRQPLYRDAVKASTPFRAQLATLQAVLDSDEGGF